MSRLVRNFFPLANQNRKPPDTSLSLLNCCFQNDSGNLLTCALAIEKNSYFGNGKSSKNNFKSSFSLLLASISAGTFQ